MRKKLLIAIPALLFVVAAVGGGVLWYVNGAAQAAVDRHIANLVEENQYQEIEYETLDVHPNGDITMTNLHIVQAPFEYTLNDIQLSNFDYTSEFPRTLDVAVRGLELAEVDPAVGDPSGDDPAFAALATLLGSMNMSGKIPAEMDYSHTYDPDNAHQMEQSMRVHFPDSFTLDADNVTRGVPPSTYGRMREIDQQDPAQAQAQVMALLADVEVPSLRVSLQDHGFVEQLLGSAAANNGVSPADMRNLLVSQTRNAYLFLPQNAQDVGMTIGAEVAEFIEGSKTITITLAPEYGGKLQQLQQEVMGAVFTGNFAQVVDLLHLDVATD